MLPPSFLPLLSLPNTNPLLLIDYLAQKILTVVPLFFMPLYLPLVLSFSAPLLGLAAISSLCLTAWTTHLSSSLSPFSSSSSSSYASASSSSYPSPSRKHLSEKARGKLPARYPESSYGRSQTGRTQEVAHEYAERYAWVANLVLCILLLGWAWSASGTSSASQTPRSSSPGDTSGTGSGGGDTQEKQQQQQEAEWIPIIAPVAVAAIGSLGSWWVGEKVDVAGLERLRYRLKGV
jgi:hypothetical protein